MRIARIRDIAAVVFDLDGVLVDSESMHFRSANAVLRRNGAEIGEADYIDSIGIGERETWRRWKERFGLPPDVDRLLAEHTAARLDDIAGGVEPIAPAVDLARHLHTQGLGLAIASSSTREIIDALVAALELDGVFRVRISGEDAEIRHPKPAPDVYLAAAARLGADPANCIAIEDSAPGVASAVAAGMTCIAVPNRWTAEQDFRDADIVLAGLEYFGVIVL